MDEIGPRRRTSVKEKVDSVFPWMENRIRRGLSLRNAKKRLPILEWAAKYSMEDAVGDLVAGITVGLTVVPQSLAYANIAGLPPQVNIKGTAPISYLGSLALDTNYQRPIQYLS